MISAFNKLINDRVSSPLFSTFIVSWLISNWKIWYITFFVAQDKLKENKLDYVGELCVTWDNWSTLIAFPAGATLLLLFVVPYAEGRVYKTYLKFQNDRKLAKEKYENDTRLSLDESQALRKELVDNIKDFTSQLSNKERIISAINQSITDSGTRAKAQEEREWKRLNIAFAGYGIYPKFADVTEFVRKRATDGELHFIVNGTSIPIPDPAIGHPKDLLLSVVRYGTGLSIIAPEHSLIESTDKELIVTLSDNSKVRYRFIQNDPAIADFERSMLRDKL